MCSENLCCVLFWTYFIKSALRGFFNVHETNIFFNTFKYNFSLLRQGSFFYGSHFFHVQQEENWPHGHFSANITNFSSAAGSFLYVEKWTQVIILWESLFLFTPARSAVLLCPAHLDVGLGNFLAVPGVHLLSDTLFTPHTYHAGADSTAVSSAPLTRMQGLRLKERSGPCGGSCPAWTCASPSVTWLRRFHPRNLYISNICSTEELTE